MESSNLLQYYYLYVVVICGLVKVGKQKIVNSERNSPMTGLSVTVRKVFFLLTKRGIQHRGLQSTYRNIENGYDLSNYKLNV